jgi:hypothetical protein
MTPRIGTSEAGGSAATTEFATAIMKEMAGT